MFGKSPSRKCFCMTHSDLEEALKLFCEKHYPHMDLRSFTPQVRSRFGGVRALGDRDVDFRGIDIVLAMKGE